MVVRIVCTRRHTLESMFKEFEEIVAVGDPVDMARRLDEMDVKLERMARDYAELDRASEAVRISETDPSGAITVIVDAHGQLLEVHTTPAVARLAPERVGPAVLACVKRAQAKIAGQVAELARHTVGSGEMAMHVVNTMRERFPEPAPEPERGFASRAPRAPVMDLGGDEFDDPLGRWRGERHA